MTLRRGCSVHGDDHTHNDRVHLSTLTILLADADPDMRLYLRSCLRGLTPSSPHLLDAADGLDALRLIRAGAVDLVIAHVALGGLDGRRLRHAVADDPTLGHVRVLLLDPDAQGDALPATTDVVDGVLRGPFNARQLREALRFSAPPPA